MQDNKNHETFRRGFLKSSAFCALSAPAFFAAAEQVGKTTDKRESGTPRTPNRIQRLSMRTAVPLQEMSDFYRDVLEMNVHLSDAQLVIDAGETQITFAPAESGAKPYYHFAFNIPENKILSARNWLGERTELAITPPNNRAKGYPNEVMPLGFWNSHSIYFWDPAGNILELICRHDMQNGTKGEFRSDEILYASEIGLVTAGSVDQLAAQIKSTFQLSQYRGGASDFRAVGDENGLLILFTSGGTPIGAKKGQTWQTFPTNVSVQSNKEMELVPTDLPFSIRTI